MKLEEIYFQNHDQINYSLIKDEDLKQLVLDFIDPFIATNSLSELSIRHSELVKDLANRILTESLGDKYLQSIAFKVLYEFDKEKAITYIEQNYLKCDKRILQSILESIIIDEEYFKNNPYLTTLAKDSFIRFKKIPKEEFIFHDDYKWIIKNFLL